VQELLGRIARLDPSASLGLRVIACFDELSLGNVNSRALLAAAASLAGCTAGYQRAGSAPVRIAVTGEHAPPQEQGPGEADLSFCPSDTDDDGAMTVWLERGGDPLPNDAIILERLSLALRLRHGLGSGELDHRRHVGLLLDHDASPHERLQAGAELGLQPTVRYRVAAAPLFAVWTNHPTGVEDVIGTPFGPIHTVVVPESTTSVQAQPVGIGSAATPEHLHLSFRTALVALRLCSPPEQACVLADDYGGLIDLLADLALDSQHRDADAVAAVCDRPWGLETIGSIVTSQTVREAARGLNIHHSTMRSRLDMMTAELGFNPNEGLGRSRLGIAYLIHRLRTSRVLDLPAP